LKKRGWTKVGPGFSEGSAVVLAEKTLANLLSCLNKVVDEKLEVPHNLVSLLLTNKTIRSDAEGKSGAGKVL
jgi:hypothetical protein